MVSGDTNNRADIFVRDRYSCSTVRVSLNSTSGQALGFDSDYPSISADGNLVAFQSASKLVTGDTNDDIDIFVRNIATGQTTRVSVGRYSTTPGGPIQTIQSNGYSVNPVISGDGRYVAFVSVANNLVQNDNNNFPDIFVHDLQANTTFRVSINSQGGEALGGGSYEPAISSDGNYIAFSSTAYNLVPNDTNGASDVFVHSRVPSQTIRVSLTWQGGQTQAPFPDSPDSASPSISADGNFVSFISSATNLVPFDPNNTSDVFIRNLQTNPDETTIVSTRSDSQPSFGGTPYSSSVSQDGRLVVFLSDASDLIMPIYDTNNGTDVFAKSRQSGQTTRLSVFPNGTTQIPGGVGGSVMSQDGRYVTFVTTYSIVTDNYLNNADIYVVPAPDGWADTIALFGPATGGISLIDTLQDKPPLSAYTVMDTNFTTSSLNTYWVMGDWNGDGQKTPGYSANGVFFYTNDLIVDNNTIWSGIWIGLSGPAVAGHFMGALPNDCIGAVDIKDFPPYGYGMALYFTCNFVDGTAPPLTFQWLGVPLPTDPPAPVNFYQFAAGDWNGDGVETMAVRREQFIAFTNTPPTTYLSEMNLAQYFGTPCNGDTDSGVFVAGDWDNNGLDSFGLYCEFDPSDPNGLARFYRRNDLDWNSGVYILQMVGRYVGSFGNVPVRAASWRLR
ncbi:MAG: hypothetical protein BroJett018_54480 [Chloroflexota bacterium]|nr:hypothetical protein [Chloroflexota bacterium]NOG66168.1 hypothetical protein [Chloroflexota bacterium]GIK67654.1 MAG: hypothetical protein BroJett018_54480 [Chloroflexota bacterium]